ncbi:MAG TPA: pyridoxal phosphate-dependent aminotransferase [Anaeromyxobacteraceae bacterium]|nr:pyridoxal phosphate-dependent aminotransferase [Anaeromyxobacteraceae bacterium]
MVAKRMSDVAPFHVMEVMARAHELEKRGRSIVHMEVGEPDFPTPPPVLAAATRALASGNLPYTLALGLPTLREAIARFYRQRYSISVDPERVVVTAGSSGALLLTMGVLVDPGAEVLLTDPGYPCNRQFVRMMGGEPVGIEVGPTTAYQPTPELVERRWSAKTAAVLVASPANPTGTLIEHEVLRGIGEVASRRGGWLIVDEIYHGLTYGREARTALSFSEEVFVVNSFSKYFDMTGWRLGWMVVPSAYVRDVEKLAQNLFICPSTLAQFAALAAFEPENIALLEERRRQFHARRDFLLPALRELGFTIPALPQGAFYLYAGCERLARDSFSFALEILDQAGVAVTPGLDFGENEPERHLRFAYTTSMARLEEGVDRLGRFLGSRR